MITKVELNKLEMSYIEEYYEYILESKTNGQHKQAHELFYELSEPQKYAFFDYFAEAYNYESEDNEEPYYVRQLKEYFDFED
jgi:hypothetical protein